MPSQTQEVKGYRFDPNKDCIGQGGVGMVYRAKKDGSTFALKLLQNRYSENENVSGKFLQGAKVMKELNHPHIVKVHEVGKLEGRPYFSMELLSGSLYDALLKYDLSLTQRIEMARQLFSALAYTHEKGVAHRDIWPSNILYTREGNRVCVKLGDFDLAKIVQDSKAFRDKLVISSPVLSGQDPFDDEKEPSNPENSMVSGGEDIEIDFVGSVQGMLKYSAPEVKAAEVKDERGYLKADVFSLTSVLNFIFTGKEPSLYGGYVSLPKEFNDKFPIEVNSLMRDGLWPAPDQRKTSQEIHEGLFYDIPPNLDEIRRILNEKDATLKTVPVKSVERAMKLKKQILKVMKKRGSYSPASLVERVETMESTIEEFRNATSRIIESFADHGNAEQIVEYWVGKGMKEEEIGRRAQAYLGLRVALEFITQEEVDRL